MGRDYINSRGEEKPTGVYEKMILHDDLKPEGKKIRLLAKISEELEKSRIELKALGETLYEIAKKKETDKGVGEGGFAQCQDCGHKFTPEIGTSHPCPICGSLHTLFYGGKHEMS